MSLRKVKRADVPHFVPVKEGGEYPVDKKGQYKLFHTHQWPKGYTPERMRAINDVQFPVTGMGFTDEIQSETDTKIAQDIVHKTLAKSTVPVETLKFLVINPQNRSSRANTSIVMTAGDGFEKPDLYFQPATNTVQMRNIDSLRGPTNISYSLMHELGHATDFAEEPGEFVQKANASDLYRYKSGPGAPPDLEGVADAFAMAHTRVTRSDVRHSLFGSDTHTGYRRENWIEPQHGQKYVESKAQRYKKETGEELPYEEGEQDMAPQTSKTKRKKKQPKLFTEEQLGPKKRKK